MILSDTNDWVKAWLTAHGAELATKLSDESKKAIANVLLKWQGELLHPREMAYQIRPLIGLNERQAIANANYRAKLYRSMIDNGVNPKVAAERADNAATRYASKQHRYRAETIVNTELAFAYNQGAHEGVTRSIAGNYMNHCEMVWTTAGTNRVCSRCLELKDTVVGRTDESGVTLPPLHPRCRCAIMYREVRDVKPKDKPRSNEPAKPVINPVIPATIPFLTPSINLPKPNAKPIQPNKPNEETSDFEFDPQRFGTYEENKERFKHHNLPNGVVRVTRTEIHAEPYAVTEIVSKKGGITRNFYDENGDQYLQISNNDHGNVAESGYGEYGEHAHDYVLSPDRTSVVSRVSREIYDYERERNSDIL